MYPFSKEQKKWAEENGDFLARMPVIDFLELTCIDNSEVEDVMKEARSVVFYQKKSSKSEPIYLDIDKVGENFQAVSHEGRHRAAAIMKKDFDVILPVVIVLRGKAKSANEFPDVILNQDYPDSEFDGIRTEDWNVVEIQDENT